MNLKQIQTLHALGIPVWVSQERELVNAHESDCKLFKCVVDKQEWLNPKLQALYLNIMKALNWSQSDYELLLWEPGVPKLEPHTTQTTIVFGKKFKPSFQCHQVESLTAMAQSPQAKRATWHLLKPFSIA